ILVPVRHETPEERNKLALAVTRGARDPGTRLRRDVVALRRLLRRGAKHRIDVTGVAIRQGVLIEAAAHDATIACEPFSLRVVRAEAVLQETIELGVLLAHEATIGERAFPHEVDHRAYAGGGGDLDRRIE